MEKDIDKKKYFKTRKAIGILVITGLLLSAPFVKVSLDISNLVAYGATQITGLDKPGDQVAKTRSDGEDWSFTSPIDATYTIELFGPKANGNNAGNGGSVSANIALNAGDVIDIYLGPGAPTGSGARNAAKGNSGNGYGDSGLYKSVVKLNGATYMVAGGGGSQGNPGDGDGSTKFSNIRDLCASRGCPFGPGSNFIHVVIYGVGGTGGAGANGGNNVITPGANGNAGSEEYWRIYSVAPNDHYQYMAGGKGGAGGDGGASYANPNCSYPIIAAGLGHGESKIIITMGDEKLPEMDSKLIMDIKKEIIQTLGDKIDLISSTGTTNEEQIPQITVMQGKPFRKVIPAYADMQNGNSNGVTVEKSNQSDKTITIYGMLNVLGYQEVVINGKVFIFNVISEPDSSNVKVLFD